MDLGCKWFSLSSGPSMEVGWCKNAGDNPVMDLHRI